MRWFPLLMVSRFVGAVLLLCGCTLFPAAVSAHGLPPIPLALWGPFGKPTVNCMRKLNHAAQQCFHAVFKARRQCMEAQLAGASCDVPARDAAIQAAIAAAQAIVDAECRGGQLTELRYSSFDDAKTDMARACAEADTTAGMIYAPAAGGALATMDEEHRRCMTHTADMSGKLVSLMMRGKARVLDQVGMSVLTPSQKLGMLASTDARIDAAREQLARQMTDRCPNFQEPYVVNAMTFFSALERRSDCLLGTMYYQTSIACSLPMCGDGITEAGEECDDGNRNDADACGNNCTLRR